MLSICIDEKAPGIQGIVEKFVRHGCSKCLFSADGKCKLLDVDISGNWDGTTLMACPVIGFNVETEDKK